LEDAHNRRESLDMAWHGTAWQGKARQGKARQGMAWHGMAWQEECSDRSKVCTKEYTFYRWIAEGYFFGCMRPKLDAK